MAFKLATLFVDVVTNQGNFDASMSSMRGALGPMISMTQRMAEQGSNLFETMNKVDVTFGRSRETVIAMANDMAIRFGTVKGVSLDAAANFGLIGQAVGMTESQSAALAVQMTRLADDASSFFNVPMDVALEKIRAGLTGQIRPLREFGVLLSKSAVDHELMAMGVQKVHGEFTEQEKVMARVKIITEGLAKAQGDHERTMGSYVNQVRKARGEMENYSASIGAGVAGAEAQFLVNVRDKGVMGALGAHAADAANALFGGGDNAFQKAADVAAGVQTGLDAKMFRGKPETEEQSRLRDPAMAAWVDMFNKGVEEMDYALVVKGREHGMAMTEFMADFFGYDTKSPKQYADEAKRSKAEAVASNEFMRDFLDIGPESKGERFRAESVGAADFASSLRLAQGGGDVGEKQLSELQQIRKQDADSTKAIVDAINAGSVAVLG